MAQADHTDRKTLVPFGNTDRKVLVSFGNTEGRKNGRI